MTNLNEYLDDHKTLSVSSYAKRRKNDLIILSIIFPVFHLILLILFRNSVPISIAVLAWGTISALVANSYLRMLSSLSLKGEHLIFNFLKGKTIVTPIRSVKNISTKSFLMKRIVFVRFKLDGKNHKAILINSNVEKDCPEEILRAAIEHVNKKRQIYKPGSVSVA